MCRFRERTRKWERKRKQGRTWKDREMGGGRVRGRRSTAWLTNRVSLQSQGDEKKRRREGEGVWESKRCLMRPVKPTTLPHSPHYRPPPIHTHTLLQKIYACFVSIPPISYEGSAEGRADRRTAGEALASRVWCYLGVLSLPSSCLGWGVCSELTGQIECPASWKPSPGIRTGHILPVAYGAVFSSSSILPF